MGAPWITYANLISAQADVYSGGSMPTRYTITQLVRESGETLRHDSIKRRSSGLRYWLLVPFAGFVIYAFVAWFSLLGISAMAERFRMKLDRMKAPPE